MILGNIHSREELLDYGFAIQQVLDWLISGGKFAQRGIPGRCWHPWVCVSELLPCFEALIKTSLF